MADFDVTRLACGDFVATERQITALERAVEQAPPHMTDCQKIDWRKRAENAERALQDIVDANSALRAAIQYADGLLKSASGAQ